MQTDSGTRPSFAPRHWPGWLLVAILWLIGQLPASWGRGLSYPLGSLMRVLMGSRRKVVVRNIERCFPELSASQQQTLVKKTFVSLARTLFEMAWCWAAPIRRLDRMGHLEGIEHMAAAVNRGKGVLCVSFHSTCLEMGGYIMGSGMQRSGWAAIAIYRPLKNPVVEWFQNRGRMRYAGGLISKRNMRDVVRQLRRGQTVWYAPDQDFGPEQSAFAPFFGIQTASLLATHKLAALTGCAVVPMVPQYEADSGSYRVRFLPALEDFPSGDEVADLTRINRITEDFIREAPDQYWWVHRRFKTRPPGEPAFYS